MTAEPARCITCGMRCPPPEQTCTDGNDHTIGGNAEEACPWCGRLAAACSLRPCSERERARGLRDA